MSYIHQNYTIPSLSDAVTHVREQISFGVFDEPVTTGLAHERATTGNYHPKPSESTDMEQQTPAPAPASVELELPHVSAALTESSLSTIEEDSAEEDLPAVEVGEFQLPAVETSPAVVATEIEGSAVEAQPAAVFEALEVSAVKTVPETVVTEPEVSVVDTPTKVNIEEPGISAMEAAPKVVEGPEIFPVGSPLTVFVEEIQLPAEGTPTAVEFENPQIAAMEPKPDILAEEPQQSTPEKPEAPASLKEEPIATGSTKAQTRRKQRAEREAIAKARGFRVGPAKDKRMGFGLFATKVFEKKDLIFYEIPVLQVVKPLTNWCITEANYSVLSKERRDAVDNLNKRCMCGRTACKEPVLEQIFHNNAKIWYQHSVGPGGLPLDGVERGNFLYTTASRANHSCDPNACYIFTEEGDIVIHARRAIDKGEEVTFQYELQKRGGTYTERKERMKGFGFKCLCEACVEKKTVAFPKPEHYVEENLFQVIPQTYRKDHPKIVVLGERTVDEVAKQAQVAEWGKTMMQVLEDERPHLKKLLLEYGQDHQSMPGYDEAQEICRDHLRKVYDKFNSEHKANDTAVEYMLERFIDQTRLMYEDWLKDALQTSREESIKIFILNNTSIVLRFVDEADQSDEYDSDATISDPEVEEVNPLGIFAIPKSKKSAKSSIKAVVKSTDNSKSLEGKTFEISHIVTIIGGKFRGGSVLESADDRIEEIQDSAVDSGGEHINPNVGRSIESTSTRSNNYPTKFYQDSPFNSPVKAPDTKKTPAIIVSKRAANKLDEIFDAALKATTANPKTQDSSAELDGPRIVDLTDLEAEEIENTIPTGLEDTANQLDVEVDAAVNASKNAAQAQDVASETTGVAEVQSPVVTDVPNLGDECIENDAHKATLNTQNVVSDLKALGTLDSDNAGITAASNRGGREIENTAPDELQDTQDRVGVMESNDGHEAAMIPEEPLSAQEKPPVALDGQLTAEMEETKLEEEQTGTPSEQEMEVSKEKFSIKEEPTAAFDEQLPAIKESTSTLIIEEQAVPPQEETVILGSRPVILEQPTMAHDDQVPVPKEENLAPTEQPTAVQEKPYILPKKRAAVPSKQSAVLKKQPTVPYQAHAIPRDQPPATKPSWSTVASNPATKPLWSSIASKPPPTSKAAPILKAAPNPTATPFKPNYTANSTPTSKPASNPAATPLKPGSTANTISTSKLAPNPIAISFKPASTPLRPNPTATPFQPTSTHSKPAPIPSPTRTDSDLLSPSKTSWADIWEEDMEELEQATGLKQEISGTREFPLVPKQGRQNREGEEPSMEEGTGAREFPTGLRKREYVPPATVKGREGKLSSGDWRSRG